MSKKIDTDPMALGRMKLVSMTKEQYEQAKVEQEQIRLSRDSQIREMQDLTAKPSPSGEYADPWEFCDSRITNHSKISHLRSGWKSQLRKWALVPLAFGVVSVAMLGAMRWLEPLQDVSAQTTHTKSTLIEIIGEKQDELGVNSRTEKSKNKNGIESKKKGSELAPEDQPFRRAMQFLKTNE